jgi:UDP-N-acetylmuramoylalanine--D-glutamate ligase
LAGICNSAGVNYAALASNAARRETVSMAENAETLKGQKVLVVGLGRSGMSAALFLRERGAQVTVSDMRSAEALAREIPTLLEAGVMVESGGHGLLTFRRQDLIVVSPGVPLATPELRQAIGSGVPVIGEIELAGRFLQGRVLSITGTNGKTTTTTLAGKLLAEGGLQTQVGGNIGLPAVEMIRASTPETWNVIEISSFQLETIEKFRAQIAVVLNITPDHLDRHGSMENYIAAKCRILENQSADDAAVLNADDDIAHRLAKQVKGKLYWFSRSRAVRQGTFVVPPTGKNAIENNAQIVFVESEGAAPEKIMPVSSIPIKGMHNLENVLAAVCAVRLAGVSAGSIRKSVESFKAVEHRLEFVATVNGVEYYNDSKATNVDATMKALTAFSSGIHLILGGKDKDSDYTQLGGMVRERVAAVYTIGSAAEKIARELAGVVKIEAAGTLALAVQLASAAARAGEIVLLAPACSSFDQFENYEHRGRVFKELVLQLRGKTPRDA